VSRGCLSPCEEFYATSGWNGECKVWGIPDCEQKTLLKGHTDRAISIKFHPQSGTFLDKKCCSNIATCSVDKSIKLWSFDKQYEF
jgi:U4/U6 small nuclear ribonucleoprotein PRP4